MVCLNCKSVADVDFVVGQSPCLTPSNTFGFAVQTAEITFWGLCSQCQTDAPWPVARAAPLFLASWLHGRCHEPHDVARFVAPSSSNTKGIISTTSTFSSRHPHIRLYMSDHADGGSRAAGWAPQDAT